ncbi:MAG: response regulator [Butyrivibrio sp.]|nr:response regulator [Butyrivibrio sp.]
MAYKCLLVDDEENVITAIIQKIDWESIGFETPKIAHNGLEALDLAEEENVDVVMTDIQMPYMDGLELSKELKRLYPGIRIIVFSGFNEFEYAKEAIKFEAEEYILKPINADELLEVFTKIRNSLDKQREETQSIKKLSKYYAESLPILQENFYGELVSGRIAADRIDELLLNYQIDLKGPYYETLLIHVSRSESIKGLNPLLLNISVERLARERLGEKFDGKFFSYHGDIAMIAQMKDSKDVIELTDISDSFCRLSKVVCKAVVTVGIGLVVTDLSDICESMNRAGKALTYRSVYGTGKAINIMEIESEDVQINYYTGDQERSFEEILNRIQLGKEIDIDKEVDDYILTYGVKYNSINGYEFFTIDTMNKVYHFIVENRLNIDEIFVDRTISTILPDKQEFKENLVEILKKIKELIGNGRNMGLISFAGKAQKYVRDNYSDENITIDKVCSQLGVSAAYFSTVFKKETGKTFVNYLTDYRMEKAARLLKETDEKTYMIASKVGFSDPNYFSYVFKRQFGVSPSKYRNGES